MATKFQRRVRALLFTGAVSALATSVPAATITFNDVAGLELNAGEKAAFRYAANFWASKITNDIEIHLNVGQTDLGAFANAVTYSNAFAVNVQDVYAALAANATTALDATAVTHLTPLVHSQYSDAYGIDGIDMVTPGYTGFDANGVGYGIDNTQAIFDRDGSFNNAVLGVNTANGKALGLLTDQSIVDGTIYFNSTGSFDLNPGNGISPDAADFIGVALHEIGHALGFVSGVDDYDVLGGPYGYYADFECLPSVLCRDYPVNDYAFARTIDLFRYSDYFPSALGDLVLVPGVPSFFSVDGGATSLGGFSSGTYHGNGWGASHWDFGQTEESVLGIMDPASYFGELRRVSGLDFAAFDVIGYNFNFDFSAADGDLFTSADAVPEPSTWALLITGLGLAGAALRRRRSATALGVRNLAAQV